MSINLLPKKMRKRLFYLYLDTFENLLALRPLAKKFTFSMD